MGNCLSGPSTTTHSSPIAPTGATTTTNSPLSSTEAPRSPSARAPENLSIGSTQRRLSSRKGKERAYHRRSTSSILMGPMASRNALSEYATLSNPNTSLPPSTLLLSTPNTIAVFDAYPKAKYHFLVLPRYPFPPQSDPQSKQSIVSLKTLDNLKALLLGVSRDGREPVLEAMADTAREVEEMIRDEMIKTEGFEWKINIGFHAVPSMRHIHLHVISEDHISPSLKTKKHYNSFRPDLGFFISLMDVQRWIQLEDGDLDSHVESLSGAHTLLNTPLTCFKCDEPFHNIPKLKQHLEKEFAKEKSDALRRIARYGQQASSDEEVF